MLLRWDQPKALAHLEEHDLLTPGRAGFAAVMTALVKSGVLLPRERLLSLIDEMDLPLTTERDGTALLTMLALHKHEDDQSALIDYMDYPGPLAAAACHDDEPPAGRVETPGCSYQECSSSLGRCTRRPAFSRSMESRCELCCALGGSLYHFRRLGPRSSKKSAEFVSAPRTMAMLSTAAADDILNTGSRSNGQQVWCRVLVCPTTPDSPPGPIHLTSILRRPRRARRCFERRANCNASAWKIACASRKMSSRSRPTEPLRRRRR